MAQDKNRAQSPTLPLPPPARVDLADFFEVAAAAGLRALSAQEASRAGRPVDPTFRPPVIWVGIVVQHPNPDLEALGGFGRAARE